MLQTLESFRQRLEVITDMYEPKDDHGDAKKQLLKAVTNLLGKFIEGRTERDKELRFGRQPEIMKMIRQKITSENIVEVMQRFDHESKTLSRQAQDEVMAHLLGYAMTDPDAQSFLRYHVQLQGPGDVEVGTSFVRLVLNGLYCDMADSLSSAFAFEPGTSAPAVTGVQVHHFVARDNRWWATLHVDLRHLLRLSRVLAATTERHANALDRAPRVELVAVELPEGMTQSKWNEQKKSKQPMPWPPRAKPSTIDPSPACGCVGCGSANCGCAPLKQEAGIPIDSAAWNYHSWTVREDSGQGEAKGIDPFAAQPRKPADSE